VIDPLVRRGPADLRALLDEGAWAAPMSVDGRRTSTRVTSHVHTGVHRSVHGATVLIRTPRRVKARRLDYAIEAGKSVGVFGSITLTRPASAGLHGAGPLRPTTDVSQVLEPVQM